ncbi:MAG: hypothetical protein ACYTXI_24910 [Nostoc sp.]
MIATHPWLKTRFIASLQMIYLSHSFFQIGIILCDRTFNNNIILGNACCERCDR